MTASVHHAAFCLFLSHRCSSRDIRKLYPILSMSQANLSNNSPSLGSISNISNGNFRWIAAKVSLQSVKREARCDLRRSSTACEVQQSDFLYDDGTKQWYNQPTLQLIATSSETKVGQKVFSALGLTESSAS